MIVYECQKCGELDAEKPTRVDVFLSGENLPNTTVYLCRRCLPLPNLEAVGRWTNNGYTWTGAGGTTVNVHPVERLPRQVDHDRENCPWCAKR